MSVGVTPFKLISHWFNIAIHILYVKGEGKRIQRNANANPLEVFCSTHFYGPLVVAYSSNYHPHKLLNFTPEDLETKIAYINEKENKMHPLP